MPKDLIMLLILGMWGVLILRAVRSLRQLKNDREEQ